MEPKNQIAVVQGQMQITTIEEAFRQASLYHKSGLVPKSFDTPEKVLVGLQYAAELQLPQLTALRSMYVINGTPSLFGDLPLSLVMRSDQFESIVEKQFDESGKEICTKNENLHMDCFSATCIVKRKGQEPVERSYSWAEIVKGGLDKNKWGQKETYLAHRRRMLQMRARTWALKDTFPDVLMGIAIKEYDDFEPKDVTETENTVQIKKSETVIVPEIETTNAEVFTEPVIEPPKIDTTENIDEPPYPQSGGGLAWPDQPDEQGFVKDPEKPFIKHKVKDETIEEKKKSFDEILSDRSGETLVTCWKKFDGYKIKDIPQEDLMQMLEALDKKIIAKTKMPEEWDLFYSTACMYLKRKKAEV